MKAVRILVAVIVVTVFGVALGALSCGWLFKWVYEIEPTNVWKSMEPPGVGFLVGGLVLNLLFVLVYVMLNKGIPGSSRTARGLLFGLCAWAVGTLPGMLATYAFMTVASTVVIYWIVFGLVQNLLKGLIVALICDGKPALTEADSKTA